MKINRIEETTIHLQLSMAPDEANRLRNLLLDYLNDSTPAPEPDSVYAAMCKSIVEAIGRVF